jgi:hypothetical protein
MKFEAGSLKCGRRRGLGVSNFTFHFSSFHLAATIKRNFEELGG